MVCPSCNAENPVGQSFCGSCGSALARVCSSCGAANPAEQRFCGDCGSALFGRDPETKEVVIVRLGAIDGDPGIRPQAHQFVAYAAPWAAIPDDGLPRFEERIPGT